MEAADGASPEGSPLPPLLPATSSKAEEERTCHVSANGHPTDDEHEASSRDLLDGHGAEAEDIVVITKTAAGGDRGEEKDENAGNDIFAGADSSPKLLSKEAS